MNKSAKSKYDTCVNIMGSIPDYAEMIQYIISQNVTGEGDNFSFRTSHSTERFKIAINSYILQFANEAHKRLFMSSLCSDAFSLNEKLLMLFWQLTYTNFLFHRITDEVYMKAVYQGRASIQGEEILAFLHYVKEQEPQDLTWSELTMKVVSSKYLTLLKKLGLVDGTVKKHILHPLITNDLFVWFVRWCQLVFPDDRSIHNPYIRFGFMDDETLVMRLKKIDNIKYWNISQIGSKRPSQSFLSRLAYPIPRRMS